MFFPPPIPFPTAATLLLLLLLIVAAVLMRDVLLLLLLVVVVVLLLAMAVGAVDVEDEDLCEDLCAWRLFSPAALVDGVVAVDVDVVGSLFDQRKQKT